MNGSNNFAESDNKPLHLCPVCLRKLQLACQFDVVEHYERLSAFCQAHDMTEQAGWYSQRAQSVTPWRIWLAMSFLNFSWFYADWLIEHCDVIAVLYRIFIYLLYNRRIWGIILWAIEQQRNTIDQKLVY